MSVLLFGVVLVCRVVFCCRLCVVCCLFCFVRCCCSVRVVRCLVCVVCGLLVVACWLLFNGLKKKFGGCLLVVDCW